MYKSVDYQTSSLDLDDEHDDTKAPVNRTITTLLFLTNRFADK